jgi:hypothetical protein
MPEGAWDLARTDDGRAGTGNWHAFQRPLDDVYRAAEAWRQDVAGVERPWLCWNVNDDWCLLQQRLAQAVGWTPVVGWDSSNGVGVPPLVSGAVAIDFNLHLGLPVLWMHFPLEFAFLWTERLAFWHSDLLVRLPKLQRLARQFESLRDGEMAAVASYGSLRRPTSFFKFHEHRFFELVGCTTRGASESQFVNGSGWWRNIESHPNCPDAAEKARRARYFYDHGVGIMYWKRHYGGRVRSIPPWNLREGHFAQWAIGAKRLGSKSAELAAVDISAAARRLGLEAFL